MKTRKLGIMLIAAVLVMALTFAGAASADVGPFPNDGVLVNGQTYTLTGDVDLSGLTAGTKELTVGTGVTATIDLNGYVLKAASDNRVVKVSGTGKLTITDSSPNAEHSFTFKDGAAWTLDSPFVPSAVPLDQFDLAAAKAASAGTYHVKVTGGVMYGGSQSFSGGVYVTDGGTFEMSSGSIVGCRATSSDGGGVYLHSNSGAKCTFKMSGGSIVGCSVVTSGKGGGVLLGAVSAFTMSGGSIVGCSAGSGGGVILNNYDSEFDMTGGSIVGCRATSSDGGGVFVTHNKFTMSGGSIKDCSASHKGGGVFVYDYDGTFTMSSGSITGCSAASADFGGGGVYVSSATFTMNGGSISSCTAASSKGAYVFHDQSGTVNLNNGLFDTTSWTVGNFCKFSTSTYDVMPEPDNKATLKNGLDPVWTQWSSSSKDVVECPFSAPAGKYFGYWTDEDGKKVNSPMTGNPGNVYNANWVDPVATIKETGAEYVTVDAAFAAATAGQTIELLKDSTMASNNIQVTKTLKLDLNGKTLTANETCDQMFSLSNDATFTLKDSSTGKTGKINGNGCSGVYISNAKFIMESGTIENCQYYSGSAVYLSGDAIFTMNGGTIKDCTANAYGGAVYAQVDDYGSDATFTMNGGTIKNCTAPNWSGGAVYLCTFDGNVMFTMNGGTIVDCSAGFCGGAVYANSMVSFTMNDGTITGCNAGYGGGVYSNGIFTMAGGFITDCSADYGGGVYVANTFTMTGGSITECSANKEGAGVYISYGYWSSHYYGNFIMNSTAYVADDNDVYLMSNTTDKNFFTNFTLGDGGFSSSDAGAFSISLNGVASDWIGKTIVKNGASGVSHFRLSPTLASSYHLEAVGEDLKLADGPTAYTITVALGIQHGDVKVNQESAIPGMTIVVTPTPENGYAFKELIVKDKKGNPVELETETTFIMPAADVIVSAVFEPAASNRGHSASIPKDYTPSSSVPVMVQETAQPTTAPTLAAPTMMPTTKPTTQATQKSPAPFAGLLAGLGAAALLIRMRR